MNLSESDMLTLCNSDWFFLFLTGAMKNAARDRISMQVTVPISEPIPIPTASNLLIDSILESLIEDVNEPYVKSPPNNELTLEGLNKSSSKASVAWEEDDVVIDAPNKEQL